MLEDKNQFAELAGFLATTLNEKNKAYGNSFDESVDTWGKNVMGIRIQDKCNRIQHLLLNDEQTENNESIAETMLDNAGYSLLAIRYMWNHGMLSDDEIKQIEDKYQEFLKNISPAQPTEPPRLIEQTATQKNN